MVVVDSSVWVDHFRDRPTPAVEQLRALIPTRRLATGDLMVREVLQGIRDTKEVAQVHDALLRFVILPMVTLPLAVRAAENYRLLRRKGVTVRGTMDCLIATAIIEGGHTLLHSDRDFDPFEKHLGLQVLR